MSKWLILGILISSPLYSIFAQTVAIDSGYTYREVVPSICDAPDHMCHYFKFVSFNDIQVMEFAMRRMNSGGIVTGFMNFRVLFPNGFNRKDTATKYPGIVMLHGAGEAGRSWQGHFEYFPTDEEYDNNGKNINHGGNAHIQAVNRDPSLPNSYPGFVIWPQNHHSAAWEAGWSGGALAPDMVDIATFIEYFIKEYNLNQDRIVMHGLSNGAKGVWDFASKRPDLVAGILPFSGVPRDYEAQSTVLVTTPVWLFQGGLDTNPSPGSAQQIINLLITKGGNPRFTLYADLGHGTWNTAIAEPEFFPWIKSQDKKDIYVFGGDPEICAGGTLRLGFSANYLAYQWLRNGVNIAGATTRYYNVTQPGVYTVKFRRRTNNKWSQSNPTEVTLKSESTFAPLLTKIGSTTLPIRTGTTNLPGVANNVVLTAPLGFTQYTWYEPGVSPVTNASNTRTVSNNAGAAADAGTYTVRVLEATGCQSLLSNPINITFQSPQPTTLLPRPTLAAISPTEVTLTWNDVADETGYEIWQYRRTVSPYPGLNWRLLTILPANTTSFTSAGFRPVGQYQFRIRAISGSIGTFSQIAPQSGFLNMPDDNTPPTPPTDLNITNVRGTAISMEWAPSTDNDVIHRYRIYLDGNPIADIFNDNTGDQTDGNPAPPFIYTYTNLTPATSYLVDVRAVDFRGNLSDPAGAISVTTPGMASGLTYNYFQWSSGNMPGTNLQQLVQFNWEQSPQETGVVANFDIGPRNQNDRFAFEFEGEIQIDVSGVHRFYTRSDEGSRLYINGTSVVNNDGTHSATTKSGTFNFPAPGKYPIRVTFFENTSSQSLTVRYNVGTTDNYDAATSIPNSKLSYNLPSAAKMAASARMKAAEAESLQEVSADAVSIYPNPFEDKITVSLHGYQVNEIVLHDMIGRVLYQTNVTPAEDEVSIDVKSLVMGVYILNVGSTKYKIIKKQ